MTNSQTRTALITGGSRGLGKDAALNIAKRLRADIIITYATNEEAAHNTVSELRSLGVNAEALQLNLGGKADLSYFTTSLKEVLNQFGKSGVDILINNAGITSERSFGKIDENELDNVFNTNFRNLVLLTQHLSQTINDNGRIINMGTGLTRTTFSPMVVYAAMKSAVETFTRYLASDLGPRGITVNSVSPGGIDNDFNAKRFAEMPQVKDFIAGNTALGRIGKTEDIGGVTTFLCSDDAGWITGQRIEVSGGFKL